MQKLLLGIALALMAAKAQAAGPNIGNAVDFGNAVVDLRCCDLIVKANANTNAANTSCQ